LFLPPFYNQSVGSSAQDRSGLLWIHFAFAYLFTGLTLWLLLEEYKACV
jgi:hypothetical protein